MEKRVEVIIAHMEGDLRRQVTLHEIAPLVNLSPSRLRHIFKADTGVSLKQYQKQLRMQKAKQLLEDSFLSVKEIMMEIGIFDRNHFARSFRKTFGTTPTQHRHTTAFNPTERSNAAAGSYAK
jgi:transcriptional regulator GlxA family with amidase domain